MRGPPRLIRAGRLMDHALRVTQAATCPASRDAHMDGSIAIPPGRKEPGDTAARSTQEGALELAAPPLLPIVPAS